MNKKIMKYILILITSILLLSSYSAWAETKTSVWDEIVIENLRSNNPFKPQLPKKEIKILVPKNNKPDRIRELEGIKEPKENLWNTIKKINLNAPKRIEHKETITKTITPPKLMITGLIWNTCRPQAIVNGKVVDIGDSVGTTKIVAIRKTGIDISFEGHTITITP